MILQYHHVSDETPKATSLSPTLFAQHMAYLDANGFEVLPLPEIVQRLRNGTALPDRAVAITFDDAYISVYQTAFPVLQKMKWPFTVFVNTKSIDQEADKQFVGWKELRIMAAAGATIANHSYSHPHLLRRADGESETAWRTRLIDEVNKAENDIKRETGQNHRLFAYPYGEYNRQVQDILREQGYVAFAQHSGALSKTSDRLALPRFPFGGNYGAMDDFAVKASSLAMPLTAHSVRDDRGRTLSDPVLPLGVERPELELQLADAKVAARVQCFATGQGSIPVRVDGSRITARAPAALPVGRSQYNCTAPSGSAGRFYWYSEFFIRKQPNGEWHRE